MTHDKITQLKLFLQSNPNDSFVQHALGLEYVKIGDDEKAQAYFENLLTQNEQYVGTYYHLARLYERLSKPIQARETYEKGIHIAQALGEKHALSELRQALEDMDE